MRAQLWMEHGRDIIRLCVPPLFASEALLPRLRSFQSEADLTDIRVTTQSSTVTEHPANADLSILLGDPQRRTLTTHRLFARNVVVARAHDYQADKPIRSYDDLNGHTLLVHDNSPDGWEYWANQVGTRPPVPRKLVRSDSMTAIARAAQQGLGVALISWPLGRQWFGKSSLVRVFDEEVPTDDFFYVALRAEDAEREDVKRLCDWVISEFENFA